MECDMKIVINKTYGGFGLNTRAMYRYAELAGVSVVEASRGGIHLDGTEEDDWKFLFFHPTYTGSFSLMTFDEKEGLFTDKQISRNDPALIQVVEELGDDANDRFSGLAIVEIPDDVDWIIQDYDGMEWVAERHRIWA
jgi:hypothetical protein